MFLLPKVSSKVNFSDFFRLTHIGGKCTKIQPMKFDSPYTYGMVIPVPKTKNITSCLRRKLQMTLPQACVAGPRQDTSMLQSHLIHSSILPRNSENTDSRGTVSGCNVNIHYSHFGASIWAPKSQGTVILGFPLTPNTWCSPNSAIFRSSPNSHWVCATSPFTCDGNWWSYRRFCSWGLKTQFRCWAIRSQVNHAW